MTSSSSLHAFFLGDDLVLQVYIEIGLHDSHTAQHVINDYLILEQQRVGSRKGRQKIGELHCEVAEIHLYDNYFLYSSEPCRDKLESAGP